MHATYYLHVIVLKLIFLIIPGEEYNILSSSLCSFLCSLVTYFLFDLNAYFLPRSNSDYRSVLHPYRITGKFTIFLYFILYAFTILNLSYSAFTRMWVSICSVWMAVEHRAITTVLHPTCLPSLHPSTPPHRSGSRVTSCSFSLTQHEL